MRDGAGIGIGLSLQMPWSLFAQMAGRSAKSRARKLIHARESKSPIGGKSEPTVVAGGKIFEAVISTTEGQEDRSFYRVTTT